MSTDNNISDAQVLDIEPSSEEVSLTREHLDMIDAMYAPGGKYVRDQVVGQLSVHAEQIQRTFIEMGRLLLLVKEHESKEYYLECLQNLEISPRSARELLMTARKFLDQSGDVKWRALAVLPPSKLYLLARLSDDELESLEENGETEGLSKAEVTEMTTRELKSRIRKLTTEKKSLEEQHQQEIEIKDQLLEDKNRKIDELDSKLRVTSDPSRWNEKAEEYLDRLHRIIPQSSRIMGELAEIIEGIQKVETKDWEQSQRIVLEQFRFTYDQINDDLEKIDNMLRFAAPEGNSVFHSMNALRPVSSSEEEALDV